MNWFGADIYVDFAWGDPPLTADASCTWVDETAYVRSVSTRRGTTSELSPVSPGTMSVALDNSGRRFDPSNTAGAHHGELLPMTKVRFRAGAGATVVVFSGFVLGWPITYPGIVDSVVSVQCVDAMRVLEQSDCPGSAYGAAVLADSPDYYWPMQEVDSTGGSPALVGGIDLVGNPGGIREPMSESTSATAPVGESTGGAFGASGAYMPAMSTLPGSIEAWVTLTNSPSDAYNQIRVAIDDTNRFALTVANDSVLVFYSNSTTNLTASTGSGSATLANGSIVGSHHIAATVSGSTLTVYIDGVAYGTVSLVAGTYLLSLPQFVPGLNLTSQLDADPTSHFTMYSSALSAAQVLAHYEAGTIAHGHPMGERTGTRIARVLDAIGWASTDRDIATGSTTTSQWLPEGRSALAQIRDLEALEQGLFFISADGKPTFRDRKWFRGATNAITPRYTYGDGGGSEIPYEDVEIDGNHLEHIRNTVTVSYSGASVTVKDATSRTNYGIQADSVTANDLPVADGWLARQLGNFRLRARKDPTTRIPTLRIQPRGAGALATTVPSVTALELGDRVRVIRRPNGSTDPIQQDCNVLGINHTVTAKGLWTTDLYLAPARKSATEAGYMITGTSLTGSTVTSY